MFWLSLVYCALVIYGTLFPLSEWTPPIFGWANPITLGLPARASRADIFINVLAYIPFGLFLTLWLRARLGLAAAMILVCALGSGMSFVLEVLQSALPSRVTSLLDWLTNSVGTVMGAMLAATLDPQFFAGRKLMGWRHSWFAEGGLANLVLVTLALWALTQAAPFVPSLDWDNLKAGLKPLGNTLRFLSTFKPMDALHFGLQIFGLGVLTIGVARRPIVWLFIAASLLVILYKVPVVGRSLNLEILAGWLGGALCLLLLSRRNFVSLVLLAVTALLSAYALAQFAPGEGSATYPLNWILFKEQVGSLVGMGDILETLWPFMALGLLVRLITPWRWRTAVVLGGSLAVVSLTFALEWMQQYIPGRFADITDPVLASLGWLLPWLYADLRTRTTTSPMDASKTMKRWAVPALILAMVSLSSAGWMVGSHVRVDTDNQGRAMLPTPESLAEIRLPGFHFNHPRLPHPSVQDISRLHNENPDWLRQLHDFADGGRGNLDAAITLAYIEPGSQDLALLHQRLLGLSYSYRGNEQAKPVAQAYDWLYDQWSETQRAALRDKLAEGVTYLVNFIRHDRLSPYNVYLYNSPFQALIATNLALYGDDPRGELNMRFTYDLWKHRVLPVWHQVMGQNGGWHEGGEYVGIGIGQAIYQVPAMWRSATGEDLFKSEPGLRGFLDFITYRKRPDGTDFRWGDAGFFDRGVSDVIPLALEYRHAAAYSIRPPRVRPEPTSWPWGPLTDTALLNPAAQTTLPLSKHFDGVGMVVARSDWGADATYLTFKAGDNFWSHSHLDQGAFTLYKGGELALDSGFYGPKYGSDHHMNYAYQSIAHNLVTVTDPADNAPSNGKEVREIANDGGQRRLGSGWGVESAPIDRNDWLDKRDLYHTGILQRYYEGHDTVVAVADTTAAYTNSQSGSGEFSSRTRRVQRMWRTLIYDRSNDVVVVRDRVTSTHPEFRKRWLLHTQTRPNVIGMQFNIDLPPNPSHQQAGGQLTGRVILPENASIQTVGGPGYEFFVDGKNYDENGSLFEAIKNKGQPTEAGSWRVEVSPAHAKRDDEFLVVLIPRTVTSAPTPRISKIQLGNEYGVEVSGKVTRRYWFSAERNGVRLEVSGASEAIFAEDNATGIDATVWEKLKNWWRDLL
ncbi:MAG: VanZ family protein [Thiobacillaceae bacterium]